MQKPLFVSRSICNTDKQYEHHVEFLCVKPGSMYSNCWVLNWYIESWSLTLREERRLRVFENGVLRRIFGPKRDEVTG